MYDSVVVRVSLPCSISQLCRRVCRFCSTQSSYILKAPELLNVPGTDS